MPGLLAEILEAVDGLPSDERAELEAEVYEATKDIAWMPNPGPQTAAVECEADELFYGGQAGGGKTDLAIGLAITEHERSLILRRQSADTTAIVDRMAEILGTRDGLNNSTPKVWRLKGKVIDIAGCKNETDKQNFKGKPHDLIDFDEIADFTETQYRFIIAWNRSATPGQRVRVVATGNPPTTPEGLWVLKYWGAWLDETHPNPAKEGELRWYTTIGDQDVECEGPDPILVDGEMVKPRSRTFIRSKLSDNPDLAATNYDSNLAALPSELRDAYRGGKFNVALADREWQVIPTAWVKAAQDRWRPEPPDHVPMTCLSGDIALGGGDAEAWARRHGLWFDNVTTWKLRGMVDPVEVAGHGVMLLRDGAAIVIDMGGGYGSGVYSYLKVNLPDLYENKKLLPHNGSNAATKLARDKRLKFHNMRAQVWWMLREALEPGLGVDVQLPPDPELLADLTAPTWKLGPQGIKLEAKEDIKKRLGRSPDKGDCVVNAWSYGEPAVSTHWRVAVASARGRGDEPRVNVARAHLKGRGRR